jgi:hypothetical protein
MGFWFLGSQSSSAVIVRSLPFSISFADQRSIIEGIIGRNGDTRSSLSVLHCSEQVHPEPAKMQLMKALILQDREYSNMCSSMLHMTSTVIHWQAKHQRNPKLRFGA